MLSDDDVKKDIIEELGKSSWELKDGKLVKSFQFPSFIKAIDYVNEITINWKTVKLSLKSFDVDAITKRDIALAKEIDKVEEQLRKIENNKN